ncbi:MAG: hypothetical protein ACT4PT_09355 [Methanobacteriota archaeon]
MKTEKVLEVVHEVGILACMLLFIWIGGNLMKSYNNDGDFLPILGGFVLMLVGAIVILKSPSRWRERHAIYVSTAAERYSAESSKA